MTAAGGHGRISYKERIARAALGMPAGHPELITRKPGRAEWKLLSPRGAQSCGRTTSTRRSFLRHGGKTGHQERKAGGDHHGNRHGATRQPA